MYLGCLKSIPDRRNYKFATIKESIVTLPQSIDIRLNCTPIKDQDSVGSCTAFSINAMKEFLDKKEHGIDGKFDILSERYVYYIIRDMMGTTEWDSGGYINYGLKVLAKFGACLESEMPYYNAYYNFREMPTGKMLFSGAHRKISSYWEIDTIDEMKSCLVSGYPFVGGVSVYDSFKSDETAETGDVPMPNLYESFKGGHAIMFCGFNDSTGRFIFKNSWGKRWGNNGYGTISYEYVETMGWDFWTIRREIIEGYYIKEL